MKLCFLWENLGPMHVDRLASTAGLVGRDHAVIGVELFARSADYAWVPPAATPFRRITLFSSHVGVGRLRQWLKLVRTLMGVRADAYFLCHYDRGIVLATAILLRLMRRRVFTMGCSKFDDYARSLGHELVKRLVMLPYQGAISSGARNRDYFRFLGIRRDRVVPGYNSVSLARIRAQAPGPIAPDGAPFAERGFVAVARLIPKKNLALLLDAFALYRRDGGDRTLTLCGSGPQEAALRAQAAALGIADQVVFTGFLQTEAISAVLARSLALLLPSLSEQFGNVVIEAQAFGLPVILSQNCGAADLLVRTGVNGFVLNPDDREGLAWAMATLAGDPALWRRMSLAASEFAPLGDTARFAEGAASLAGL